MSDGAKKSGSKTSQAWKAHALLEKFGFDSIEEMEAALSALAETKDESVAAVAAAAPPAPVTAARKDELGWIDRDIHAVHFVARYGSICVRPPQTNVIPPIEGIQIIAHGFGEWRACPFDLRGRSKEQEVLNMVHYGRWSYLAISRDEANAVYSDARWPIPKRAVLSLADYRGWDRAARQARGTYTDLAEPDPLREATRRILQRFPGEAFIDATYHREMPDLRIANPYGNRLLGLVLKLPAVKLEGATT